MDDNNIFMVLMLILLYIFEKKTIVICSRYGLFYIYCNFDSFNNQQQEHYIERIDGLLEKYSNFSLK